MKRGYSIDFGIRSGLVIVISQGKTHCVVNKLNSAWDGKHYIGEVEGFGVRKTFSTLGFSPQITHSRTS
jgi:hypothetical protein